MGKHFHNDPVQSPGAVAFKNYQHAPHRSFSLVSVLGNHQTDWSGLPPSFLQRVVGRRGEWGQGPRGFSGVWGWYGINTIVSVLQELQSPYTHPKSALNPTTSLLSLTLCPLSHRELLISKPYTFSLFWLLEELLCLPVTILPVPRHLEKLQRPLGTAQGQAIPWLCHSGEHHWDKAAWPFGGHWVVEELWLPRLCCLSLEKPMVWKAN